MRLIILYNFFLYLVLKFIRALYMLDCKSMQAYPLYDRSLRNLAELSPADFMPRVPEEYLNPAKIGRTDTLEGLRDVILKSMQIYNKEQDPAMENWIIDQVHIDVFSQISKFRQQVRPLPMSGVLFSRQRWDDMFAVCFIEKVIATIFWIKPSNLYAYEIFDAYTFHCRLLEETKKDAAKFNHTSTLQDAVTDDSLTSPTIPNVKHFSLQETSSKTLKATTIASVPDDRITLPIDEHESTILSTVKSNRVTVIHAETGAGKSTRVPCMLLNANNVNGNHKPKLFISQPRRIAAKALVERLRKTEPELRDCFALRLGHGVREYHNKNTRACFCTSGYLVRLLANKPEVFAKIDYIVIDEVHERSVDSDILCLLCRRLLQNNDRIKLILMSATLASEMYRDYFNVKGPAIFVGARRFPVHEVYIEELISKLNLPPRTRNSIETVKAKLAKMKCLTVPDNSHMEILYSIATQLIMEVGKPGSAVMIFVAGMYDIQFMFKLIEDLKVPGIHYTFLPIHSDIPFEDQMKAFRKCDDDEVKVVVATNAAESSLTLPDVDNVICFGLCKRIEYNEQSHRQHLSSSWISRANAKQRAGRAGRVRPGQV